MNSHINNGHLRDLIQLIRNLRKANQKPGLIDEVHRRLSDQALLDRADLAESLEQMRRGEGIVVRTNPHVD